MRKLLAIFLLVVFASATTEFGQFLKLPVLVQHFYKHRSEESMSLMNFLAEHYVGHHQDEDKQDDMQLPFKSMISGPSLVISYLTAKIDLPKPPTKQRLIHIPFQHSFIPSSLVFGIFHPPRMV